MVSKTEAERDDRDGSDKSRRQTILGRGYQPHPLEAGIKKQRYLTSTSIVVSLHFIFYFETEMRMAEMAEMGIGNKPCLDIRPSQDQISDRSISYAQLAKGKKYISSKSL